ncbi:SymE family type I addiction module toxin [Teredinibacter sp. KSP-S5-2]
MNKKHEVPVIYLQGRWLQEIGFAIDSQHLIERKTNKLIITLLKKKE